MLRFVRRQVEQVEKQIEHSIRNSPLWQAKRELLESMPAIGKVNSSTLLARLPELGREPSFVCFDAAHHDWSRQGADRRAALAADDRGARPLPLRRGRRGLWRTIRKRSPMR